MSRSTKANRKTAAGGESRTSQIPLAHIAISAWSLLSASSSSSSSTACSSRCFWPSAPAGLWTGTRSAPRSRSLSCSCSIASSSAASSSCARAKIKRGLLQPGILRKTSGRRFRQQTRTHLVRIVVKPDRIRNRVGNLVRELHLLANAVHDCVDFVDVPGGPCSARRISQQVKREEVDREHAHLAVDALERFGPALHGLHRLEVHVGRLERIHLAASRAGRSVSSLRRQGGEQAQGGRGRVTDLRLERHARAGNPVELRLVRLLVAERGEGGCSIESSETIKRKGAGGGKGQAGHEEPSVAAMQCSFDSHNEGATRNERSLPPSNRSTLASLPPSFGHPSLLPVSSSRKSTR